MDIYQEVCDAYGYLPSNIAGYTLLHWFPTWGKFPKLVLGLLIWVMGCFPSSVFTTTYFIEHKLASEKTGLTVALINDKRCI